MMEDPSETSDRPLIEEEALTTQETLVDDISGNLGSQIFGLLLWTTFSIVMIVLGSLYIHDCATEPKVPMYLIVAGIVHLFGVVLLILKIVDVKRTFGLEGIVGLTSFCWFIAGSVWVFAIYQDDSKDCNSIVYNFAFGVLLLQYVVLAFIATFICMSSCWAVFLATTNTENEENVRLLLK